MRSRHRGCGGCCRCLGRELTIVARPVPPKAGYLLTVGELGKVEPFFRPLDLFVVQVVHEPRLDGRAKLSEAWRYREVHGDAALVAALRAALAMPKGLDRTLTRLLDELTARVTS